MQEKLEKIYQECKKELQNIQIDVNNPLIGEIDIKLAKGNPKRYGCCKQEEPDLKYKYTEIYRNKIYIKYDRYRKHHIEISKWVMQMDEQIIKNTIIHEIIHCFPGCNNHGKTFQKYANYINKNLGYNISRVGNKEKDYQKSNIEYKEESKKQKYKITCQKCGQTFYRQRLNKNLIKKYRCSICKGKFKAEEIM